MERSVGVRKGRLGQRKSVQASAAAEDFAILVCRNFAELAVSPRLAACSVEMLLIADHVESE